MFSLRLKTKLVLAITIMVVALVTTLSSIYISQLIKQRVDEAFQNGEFVASEVFQSTREALESDLANEKLDLTDPKVLQSATEESLQTDAGLNSLMQSIVGYSPTIYDVAIADAAGHAIVHSDGNMTGKQLPKREDFGGVRNGGFWKQVHVVYGAPKVFDMQLPLYRDGQPFATVRVGISSVFLKSSLQPKLNSAFLLSGVAILFSFLLAVGVSTLAFRPLAEISRKLDQMSAGAVVPAAHPEPVKGRDEYGVVNTKIDRLGQQMRDVKEVFSALKENLDQIMSNLQDGVMLFTRDEKAVLVSSSIETFLHKSRADLLGKTAHEIFADRPRIGRLILDAFESHQPLAQVEVLSAPRDGGGAARVQIALDFIEENGERIGALLTVRDAESVHRIEDELELSRRLAAVGRLTSGVAHEVKNPINAIVVHLEVLRQKLKELDPDTRRHMDVIGTEIRRLDRVVQTLVDFTRPMELRLVEVDLRKSLDEVTNLASPDAEKHGVHVIRDISEETLPVKIDADLVKQALLNVMINGMQAMGNGGNLTITARRVDAEAQIEISDQGGGIPNEIREKIFNLYFTTKKGGSGIGLPMTYRVVQLHNGSMEFDSIEGQGTTFRLHFPLSDAGREAAAGITTSASGSTVER
jgi:PAS domain S-box-containing protein